MKTRILLTVMFSAAVCANCWAGAGQKSFTPTKYLYPIVEIDLMTADQSSTQVLYHCAAGTAAGCMVDLADTTGTGLTAITTAAQNVSIAAGTYTQIKLQNCPAGTSGTTLTTLTVQGTASVGAGPTTFATKSTGMAAGSTPADVVLPWGCGGALVTLTSPVVVSKGSAQALSLLVDLSNAVWTDPSASSGMGGCLAGTGGSQGVCGSFPLAVPYFGTGTPTFERYLVAHSSTVTTPPVTDANAEVNLGIDPAGAVFFVGGQPYYSETSPSGASATQGGPDYNASTRTMTANADGSVTFQTGGSTADNRVGFTSFKRTLTSTGTCKNELASSVTWNYQAFKQ